MPVEDQPKPQPLASSRRGENGSALRPLAPQHLAPLALMVDEACAVSRVGRNKLYIAIQTGALRAKKLGNKTLILTDDLRAWLKSLPDFVPESPGDPAAVTAAAPSPKRRLTAAE